MNLKSNKGFTLVEMIVAMLLMGILGTLVMNFMLQGSTFYKKVYTDYDARNEARLAVHYISSRIRQNDSVDAIKVEEDTNIIRIKEDAGKGNTENTISFDGKDKKLYEKVLINSVCTSKTKIADASSFKVEMKDGNSIVMTIGYTDSSKVEKKYTETLTLRSYN